MAKQTKSTSYLTPEGQAIFNRIKSHCEQNKILFEIDDYELSMLANSIYLYGKNAAVCNVKGTTQKPKGGGWDQVRPEYTVMKNEYQNIIKHSSKFGINPGDRAKIFGGMKQTKKKGFDLK